MRGFPLLPGLVGGLLAGLAACGREAPRGGAPAGEAPRGSAPAGEAPAGAAAPPCVTVPFAPSTPVPEASGAAWLTLAGAPALLVVGDSGNDGAYAIVDAATGDTREVGRLPLGDAGQDLEGLAARGDEIVGVTSSGWIRRWRRAEGGFALAAPAYPLGPVDLPDAKPASAAALAGPGMVCGARVTNCGRNYEGLCLDPRPAKGAAPDRCVGFVASKADGHLYCLEERDGRLVAMRARHIAVARAGAVADCAFDEAGALFVGANLFDAASVYRVDGWERPERARVTRVASLGLGFPEVIAARDGVLYRMSDTGGAPSLMTAHRCGR